MTSATAEQTTSTHQLRLDPVEDALRAFAAGAIVVVVDDADRENEGDLICAAGTATAEDIAFIVRHTTGIVCAAMAGELLDRLDIPLMTTRNRDRMSTAFTITVDARDGITTGVSAADRAHTLRLLADAGSRPDDFVQPGHIFPLRARDGGVLERRGHTEAAVDLARSAGLVPAGVLAELVNDDGTMMRGAQLREFADRHGLALISIEDLAAHRRG
ncbi:3,4-dihydroxy-2-butanone-4-phosphate synthase [Saccharopolyspora rosea]|uniref:3,4-dihydroxy-2-butanone 4-phosphate synthase n=1 Tax=Saccharopolyspora rosea TaxID=524884 RepID=A0ABW3FU14_9PSEU|nr:3,4-dihydroxy-2-butanone-4-phosphate synthase [Saccharopolyspora rosea]